MPQEIIPAGSLYPIQLPEDTGSRDQTKLLLFVVLKWRWLILGLFLVFTIAAAVAVLSTRPNREAVAKILLKEDRASLQISGLNARTKSQYSPEALQSEIELLKSREVLLPTAHELLMKEQYIPALEPLQEVPIWRKPLDFALSKVQALFSWNSELEDDTEADPVTRRINLLAGKTVAEPVPDTNVIQVSFYAPTATEAVKTLQTILSNYLEQRAVAYGGSAKLLSFYEQEKEQAQAKLQKAEDQFRAWQKANSIVAIDQQVINLLEMLAAQERMLQQADAGSATSRESDPLVAKLKSELVTQEIALQDLLQRYTEEDRRVREKKEHINLLQKGLASAQKDLSTSVNSQRGTLRKQITQTSGAIANLRDQRLEGDRLARNVDLHKNAFLLYGKNLEEARIAARMEKEQLSNVAVIEQPYAKEGMNFAERTGIIFLAALIGLVLGVAIAFGLEFFNNTIRTQQDVEQYLGLPVLAAIPDLRGRRYE